MDTTADKQHAAQQEAIQHMLAEQAKPIEDRETPMKEGEQERKEDEDKAEDESKDDEESEESEDKAEDPAAGTVQDLDVEGVQPDAVETN